MSKMIIYLFQLVFLVCGYMSLIRSMQGQIKVIFKEGYAGGTYYFDVEAGVEQDVLELEVPVHHSPLMHVLHSRDHLSEDPPRLVLTHPSPARSNYMFTLSSYCVL